MSEVDLVVREVEHTAYDNPNKKLIYVHEREPGKSIIVQDEEGLPSQDDQVYAVKKEPAAV